MSATTSFTAFAVPAPARTADVTKDASVFSRVIAAMMASRQRKADRELARLEAVFGYSLRGEGKNAARITVSELPFQR